MSASFQNPTTSSNNAATPDHYHVLGLDRHPDGTVARNPTLQFPHKLPTPNPDPDPNQPTPVLSKDIPINPSTNTWARIFIPTDLLDNNESKRRRLPLVVYFHGSGFIMASPAAPLFHDFCSDLALRLGLVVVSVKYRLAPEHRLPAAYDDAVESLHWIKSSQDDWLQKYADLSKCFVMGASAGGNVAYRAFLRAAAEVENLDPMKIQGLIMHSPAFGSVERTGSETMLDHQKSVHVLDLMWELSLPSGADRDHEYSNPRVDGGGYKLLERIRELGWKVLVLGGHKDPLIDHQIGVAELMKEKGIKVETRFREEDEHGDDINGPKLDGLLLALKSFVFSSRE